MQVTSSRHVAAVAALAGATLVLAGFLQDASAATSPFGIATPDGGGAAFGGPLGPLFAWIAMRQAEFYRILTSSLSGIKEDGSAAWLLMGVGFLYGIFHAAGPGHGKAVITSYLFATGESIKRGVLLSFGAAFIQALTAIAIVAVAAILFRATAQTMTQATRWVEIASYALIALMGAWLLYAKITGRGHHHHHHAVEPAQSHNHHDGDHHHDHAHCHAHDHAHGDEHGHHHHVVESRPGWAGAWSAMMAVGIRPCSGAIIVLVFALAQGLFAAGVAATFAMAVGTGLTVAMLAALAVSARGLAQRMVAGGSGGGAMIVRGLEIAAAAVVLLFGLLLLGGALAEGLPL